MLDDDQNLKRQYRMPRVFGALPGPRNVPKDKQHLRNRQSNTVLSITALTDEVHLLELLPRACALFGDPEVTIALNYMTNIGWLAGRGYAMLSVSIPIQHETPAGVRLTGNFLPVVWENMAEPIITGREELGWAKLYADIPPMVHLDNHCKASAQWQAFRFLDMEISNLTEVKVVARPLTGQFHYKYVPRTGLLTEADIEYLTYSPPGESAAGYAPLPIVSQFKGEGRFAFQSALWEDMPFQYPIINALARLPLLEWRNATLATFSADGFIGDNSSGSLRRISD